MNTPCALSLSQDSSPQSAGWVKNCMVDEQGSSVMRDSEFCLSGAWVENMNTSRSESWPYYTHDSSSVTGAICQVFVACSMSFNAKAARSHQNVSPILGRKPEVVDVV